MLIFRNSLFSIERLARDNNRLIYAAATCWWKIGDPIYFLPTGIPCDPRGSVLFETDDPLGFIEAAKKRAAHYGKHGLAAFVAAYHGNLTTDDGKPTSFRSWDQYNNILDSIGYGKEGCE